MAEIAPGDRAEYRVSLELEGSAPLPGQEGARLSSTALFEGVWAVDLIEPHRWQGCVQSVDEGRLLVRAGGEVAERSLTGLAGACAILETRAGDVPGLAFDAEVPGSARPVLEVLMLDHAVRLEARPSGAWTAHRRGSSGSGPVEYRVSTSRGPEEVGGQVVVRRRANYEEVRAMGLTPFIQSEDDQQKLTHEFEMTVNPRGVVVRSRGGEDLVVTGKGGVRKRAIRIDSRLISVTKATSPAVQAASGSPFERTEASLVPSDREAALKAQRAGLKPEDLRRAALSLTTSGGPADREVFWRGLAVLRMEREVAAEVGRWFDASPRRGPARAFLLDLLANAGTPESERAFIRRLVEVERSGDNRALADYVIRLGFVANPSRDLGEAALGTLRRTEGLSATDPLRENLMLAAGRLCGSLRRRGIETGNALRAYLVGVLERAGRRDAAVTSLALRAMGNTREEWPVSFAESHLSDGRPVVRYGATLALRFGASEEVVPMLIEQLDDASPAVQRAAFASLAQHERSAAVGPAVARALVSGGLDTTNYAEAWRAVKAKTSNETQARVAKWLLEAEGTPSHVKATVRRDVADGSTGS